MSWQTAEEVVRALGLEPHDEGGFFRRTYTAAGAPPRLTCIYYLLTRDSPRARLHANRSDIHIFHQRGGLIRYLLIPPDGRLVEETVGHDQLQLTVPGGWWKAADLVDGDYALIGEAVSPGFDYADRRLATPAVLQQWPALSVRLLPYL
ncbi:MAG TPA: cupin domain-containing protein [Candidatus Xenobia bacterium]|jgi:hypothetical protein